ncbi:hypothetical protein BS47DRAFT_1367888 [Hydnum rufescens UP504]|uniref:Uncharacterized protein n=1 Tax=Hydnum rufescens UP504 TaxID=1448309 RepID=A0A9P6AH73_9AGAM|nr:hypothetical protein BS47DRAFT_1367888 [Hydnum rufescens UP504]
MVMVKRQMVLRAMVLRAMVLRVTVLRVMAMRVTMTRGVVMMKVEVIPPILCNSTSFSLQLLPSGPRRENQITLVRIWIHWVTLGLRPKRNQNCRINSHSLNGNESPIPDMLA